jgi:tripartite ATP-independent transporter DctP family solute receptor
VKLKTIAILLALSLVFLAGCGRSGSSDENVANEDVKPITVKLTTVQLDNQQMGVAANRIKKLVDERLGDKVKLQVYTGAQLYSGVEELEALKKGDIQLTLAIGSAMGSLDSSMSLFKLPFLFPNVQVAYEILDGPIGNQVFKNLKDQGINVLGGFSSGSIIVSNGKRPIQQPADFKGLKMRTSGKMEAAIIEEMGAISVVVPSEETYGALQQGIADGLATPSTVFYARRYHEVQKYVTNAGMLYWSNGFILANDEFWQGMSEDVREEFEVIIYEVLAKVRAEDEAQLQDMLAKVEEGGSEVHTLTPEEIEAWRQAALPVYDHYKDEIGADLVDAVTKEVEALTK